MGLTRGLSRACHASSHPSQRAVLAAVEDATVADPWLCIPAEWKLIAYRDALACRLAAC